jgi:hypothetical protein
MMQHDCGCERCRWRIAWRISRVAGRMPVNVSIGQQEVTWRGLTGRLLGDPRALRIAGQESRLWAYHQLVEWPGRRTGAAYTSAKRRLREQQTRETGR